MEIAIIGGKLQGVEAAYLAGKAGWEASVIDRNPSVPAASLCNRFIRAEITSAQQLNSLLEPFDFFIPALENDSALKLIQQYARQTNQPVLFDFDAYRISSSKVASNRMFMDMQLPLPVPYPDCGFPVIVKPNHASGSHGVHVAADSGQLRSRLAASSGEQVIQGFVEGPSYSLEVLGSPGQYLPLQVTELEMDLDFDCKRVLAPPDLSMSLVADFEKMAVGIAEKLALRGLMDIEVIRDGDTLRVLEIDARLPSQTPICVYASSGANMLPLLAGVFLEGRKSLISKPASERAVIFEHIQITPGKLIVTGEHIMSSAGPLQLRTDFFGADEAITNQTAGRSSWVATLIITATDRSSVWEKRNAVIADILALFEIDHYSDPYPNLNSCPANPGVKSN